MICAVQSQMHDLGSATSFIDEQEVESPIEVSEDPRPQISCFDFEDDAFPFGKSPESY